MNKKAFILSLGMLFATSMVAQETHDIKSSESIMIKKHDKKGVFIKDSDGNLFSISEDIKAVSKFETGEFITYDYIDDSYHTFKFYNPKLRDKDFKEINSIDNISDYYYDFARYGMKFFVGEKNKSYIVLVKNVNGKDVFNVADNQGKFTFKNDLESLRGAFGKWVLVRGANDKDLLYSVETGKEFVLPNGYEFEEYTYSTNLFIVKKGDKKGLFNPITNKFIIETDNKIEMLNRESQYGDFYFKLTDNEGDITIIDSKGQKVFEGSFNKVHYAEYSDGQKLLIVKDRDNLENEYNITEKKYKHPLFYKEWTTKNDLFIYKVDENYIVFKPDNVPFITEEEGINYFKVHFGHMLFSKIDRETRKTIEGKLYDRRKKDVAQRDIPVYEDVHNIMGINDTSNYTELVFIDGERLVVDSKWNVVFAKGELPNRGKLYYDADKKAFRLQIYGVKKHQYFPIE